MIKWIRAGLVIGLIIGYTSVNAQKLTAGMAAPELKVGGWLKGAPVEKLEAGKIYVVEFWATWCGPCRSSIPHLTELQGKYKDKVTVIGVSVMEKNQDYVPVFVESMGNEMNYSVARDYLSQPGTQNGYMAQNWLVAAGAPGIPWAFIVDKTGKIAYAGQTGGLDAQLKKVAGAN